MLRIHFYADDGDSFPLELVYIELERISSTEWTDDYSVRLIVNRGKGRIAIVQKPVYGFSKELNALALLLQVLTNLDLEDLKRDGDYASSSNMARQLNRALSKVQDWKDRLRNN